MIRVCNLCLEKLAKVDEDDEDDRRSIVSSVTFPAHQLGVDILPGLGHPQSPFAASQLFGRTDEPFNLYSIAETQKIFYRLEDDIYRLIAPPSQQRETDTAWASVQTNPAPFRRALSDEGVGDQGSLENFPSEAAATPELNTFSAEVTVGTPSEITGTTSSIQFPVGSPERAAESPQSNGHRLQVSTDLDIAAPFIRSRVQSRIDNFQPVVEPGWRTRRESTA
jgi:1-phosphatidylinositol-3-phosphate 5-kinase